MFSNLQRSFTERQKLFEIEKNKNRVKEINNLQEVISKEELKRLNQKEREEEKERVFYLLKKAETRYSFGKYQESYYILEEAEVIIRHYSFENSLLSKVLFGMGKSKFKLGLIQEANDLIESSIYIHYDSEYEELLDKVKKVLYFDQQLFKKNHLLLKNQKDDSKSEKSMTNPLQSLKNSFVPTFEKFESQKKLLSWQESFLDFTHKQEIVKS